jgi:hypothetical protein
VSEATDAVDRITAQWRTERPDLDSSPMEVIGRITRASVLIQRELERVFALHGLAGGDFDVLATLRRSGTPVTPGELSRSTMVTTGGMTKRLDRLESLGGIRPSRSPTSAVPSAIAQSKLTSRTRSGCWPSSPWPSASNWPPSSASCSSRSTSERPPAASRRALAAAA